MPDIVIGDVRPRIGYAADGVQTDFPFPFSVLSADDLDVRVDTAAAAGFTVTGIGTGTGGTVSFAAPPPAGAQVVLFRAMTVDRQTDFEEAGDFRAAVINEELDRLVLMVQEDQLTVRDALRQAPWDADLDMTLPLAADRAGKVLGFDATGLPTVLSNTAESAAAASTDASVAAQAAADAATAAANAEAAALASASGVRVSGDDTTAGLLEDKFAAGAHTAVTIGAPGGNETVAIDVVASETPAAGGLIAVRADGTVHPDLLPPVTGAIDDNARSDIALLAFRVAVNGGLSLQQMTDGVVDEFEDATGLDAAIGTGTWAHDPTDAVVTPYLGTLANGSTSNGNFSNRMHIDRALILPPGRRVISLGTYVVNTGPKSLKIAKDNGDDTLDIVAHAEIGAGSGWTDAMLPTPFDVPDDGFDYLLGIWVSGGSNRAGGAGSIYRYDGPDQNGTGVALTPATATRLTCRATFAPVNVTLQSVAASAGAQSDTVYVVALVEPLETLSLGTDLILSVSRDGGTTFSPVTLSASGPFATGVTVYEGSADLSAQPAGTDMRWRIETHNFKNLRLHGVALEWR